MREMRHRKCFPHEAISVLSQSAKVGHGETHGSRTMVGNFRNKLRPGADFRVIKNETRPGRVSTRVGYPERNTPE